jgi:hypothetical protein
MKYSMKFIAETDEAGDVLWLWRLRAGERMARPVRDLDAIDLELKTCVTDGATLDAVLSWLTKERSKAKQLIQSGLTGSDPGPTPQI